MAYLCRLLEGNFIEYGCSRRRRDRDHCSYNCRTGARPLRPQCRPSFSASTQREYSTRPVSRLPMWEKSSCVTARIAASHSGHSAGERDVDLETLAAQTSWHRCGEGSMDHRES